MKAKLVIPSLLVYGCNACPVCKSCQVPVTYIKLSGYVGGRIDDCIEHRVKAQDVDHLVEPFRHRKEKSRWQSEFWGKWIENLLLTDIIRIRSYQIIKRMQPKH